MYVRELLPAYDNAIQSQRKWDFAMRSIENWFYLHKPIMFGREI